MRKGNRIGEVAVTVFLAFAMLSWCDAESAQGTTHESAPLREGPQLSVLPFSLAQVLKYFDDAFGKLADRGYDHAAVYRVAGATLDEAVTIAVSERDAKISVTLITNADWGLNYLREFFEAPFFNRAETQQLYGLLGEDVGTRSVELGRFGLDIWIVEDPGWLVITMEFRPSRHVPPG